MLSMQDKYYGLTMMSWLIIGILVLFFFFTVYKSENTNIVSSTSIKTPVKEGFAKDNGKIKVYNFNTSWCGYSVRFQPEWNKFEEEVKSKNNLSNVEAYDIKCDNDKNKQMCADYDVPGFPTVVIEKDGKRMQYDGPRKADAIVEAIQNL